MRSGAWTSILMVVGGCSYASSRVTPTGVAYAPLEGTCNPTFFEAHVGHDEVDTVATDEVSCSDPVECIDRLRSDACRVGATQVYVTRRGDDDSPHMAAVLARPRDHASGEPSATPDP